MLFWKVHMTCKIACTTRLDSTVTLTQAVPQKVMCVMQNRFSRSSCHTAYCIFVTVLVGLFDYRSSLDFTSLRSNPAHSTWFKPFTCKNLQSPRKIRKIAICSLHAPTGIPVHGVRNEAKSTVEPFLSGTETKQIVVLPGSYLSYGTFGLVLGFRGVCFYGFQLSFPNS